MGEVVIVTIHHQIIIMLEGGQHRIPFCGGLVVVLREISLIINRLTSMLSLYILRGF